MKGRLPPALLNYPPGAGSSSAGANYRARRKEYVRASFLSARFPPPSARSWPQSDIIIIIIIIVARLCAAASCGPSGRPLGAPAPGGGGGGGGGPTDRLARSAGINLN